MNILKWFINEKESYKYGRNHHIDRECIKGHQVELLKYLHSIKPLNVQEFRSFEKFILTHGNMAIINYYKSLHNFELINIPINVSQDPEVLKWFFEMFSNQIMDHIKAGIYTNNKKEFLTKLDFANKFWQEIPDKIFYRAAGAGNVFLLEQYKGYFTGKYYRAMYERAIKNNQPAVIAWLKIQTSMVLSPDTHNIIAPGTTLDIVKMLPLDLSGISQNSIEKYIRLGRLDILIWLNEIKLFKPIPEYRAHAYRFRHTHIFKWLNDNDGLGRLYGVVRIRYRSLNGHHTKKNMAYSGHDLNWKN